MLDNMAQGRTGGPLPGGKFPGGSLPEGRPKWAFILWDDDKLPEPSALLYETGGSLVLRRVG